MQLVTIASIQFRVGIPLCYEIIFRVCLLGIFDFERISISVLRLLSTSWTKIRISISVQSQDACSFAGQILNYGDSDNNKVFINVIDNFSVIVQARRRCGGT